LGFDLREAQRIVDSPVLVLRVGDRISERLLRFRPFPRGQEQVAELPRIRPFDFGRAHVLRQIHCGLLNEPIRLGLRDLAFHDSQVGGFRSPAKIISEDLGMFGTVARRVIGVRQQAGMASRKAGDNY